MKSLYFALLLCSLLTSCAQDVDIQALVQIEAGAQPDPQLLAQTKATIAERLKASVFYEGKIEEGAQANQLVVTAKIDPESKKLRGQFRALFASTKVEIWPAYQVEDPAIQELIDSLGRIPSFRINVPAYTQYAALGTCANKDSLNIVLNNILPFAQKYEDLRLLWSLYPNGHLDRGKELYELIMVKIKGTPITGQHITDTDAAINYFNRAEVQFKLDQEGTEIWSKMTTQAAQSGNRAVVIVLNDRVMSAPRVVDPILAGDCSLTGDYSLEEAHTLAASLTQGSLPYPVKILEEEMVVAE